MSIPAPPPGKYAENGAGKAVQSTSRAPDWTPVASAAATAVAAPRLAYAEFAAAIKDALRDANRPDLLARNPLLRDGICNHGGSAGPQELRSLLCDTVGTLFGNPRDETLRRVLELTYGHAALKQEVVADRLSLSFGTYRRHLSTARERLARWLWETHQNAQTQPELPSAEELTAKWENPGRRAGGDFARSRRTRRAATFHCNPALSQHRRQRGGRSLRRRHHRNPYDRSLALFRRFRHLAQHCVRL
jgi:hypothetical protein